MAELCRIVQEENFMPTTCIPGQGTASFLLPFLFEPQNGHGAEKLAWWLAILQCMLVQYEMLQGCTEQHTAFVQ